MITITGQFFLIKNCNGAGIFGTTSGVKIVLKFQDAEGRSTPEKQQMATDEIKERCYRVGFRGKPEIVFSRSSGTAESQRWQDSVLVRPLCPNSRRLLEI